MKKIYKVFSLAAIFAIGLCSLTNAQVVRNPVSAIPGKGVRSVDKVMQINRAADYSRTYSNQWINYFDAADSLAGDNGYSSHKPWYGAIFDDSSVVIEHGANSFHPDIHEIGQLLDPSAFQMNYYWSGVTNAYSFTTDLPYYVDSIGLVYYYQRATASNIVDTLITYLWYPHNGAYELKPANSLPAFDSLIFAALVYNPATNAPDVRYIGDTDLVVIKTPLHEADSASLFMAYTTNHYKVPANRLLATAWRFKPGYAYSAGDSISNTGNVFNMFFVEPNGAGTLAPYGGWDNTGADLNMTYAVPNDVRYNTAGGWDSLFIPTYAFTAGAYPFDEVQSFFNINGTFDVGIAENKSTGLTLFQNQPNPANTTTLIRYELKNAGAVNIEISDMTGRVVMNLNQGTQAFGKHSVVANIAGLSNGIYFYTLRSNNSAVTHRMVIAK